MVAVTAEAADSTCAACLCTQMQTLAQRALHVCRRLHTESHTHRHILPVLVAAVVLLALLAAADRLALLLGLLAVTDHGRAGAACLLGWPPTQKQQTLSVAVGARMLQMQRSTQHTKM